MNKNKTLICSAIFCVILGITGCSSIKTVTYSFAEGYNEQATLSFGDDLNFVAFNGEKLPEPQKGTRWDDKIIVPAGVPIETMVHVSYDGREIYAWTGQVLQAGGNVSGEGAIGMILVLGFTLARDIICFPFILGDWITAESQATNRDVILSYSALENGKKYKIYFKRKKKKYLLYLKTSSGKIIYEQEFERIGST